MGRMIDSDMKRFYRKQFAVLLIGLLLTLLMGGCVTSKCDICGASGANYELLGYDLCPECYVSVTGTTEGVNNTYNFMWIVYVVIVIAWGLIWGFATKAVIRNKGYNENWFWWGFFFGFIALLVALSKRENCTANDNDNGRSAKTITNDEWMCTCGRINSAYVSTCACGKNKRDVLNPPMPPTAKEQNAEHLPPQPAVQETKPADCPETELSRIEAIRKYKELLDAEILTQEEFEAKKKQLLRP